MHLPGLEPRITDPKSVVISISPQVQRTQNSTNSKENQIAGRIGHNRIVAITPCVPTRPCRQVFRFATACIPAPAFDSPPEVKHKSPNALRPGFVFYVRAGRIELPTHPWQGCILPLNHARNICHHSILYRKFNFNRKTALYLYTYSPSFPHVAKR